MKKITLSLLLLSSTAAFAQNVAINATGATAVSSAALDVDMANKGILIPRVALTTTAAFAPVTGTATVSLLVFNTATAGAGATVVTPGFYYWDGAQWVRMGAGATSNDWIVGTSAANVNSPGGLGYFGTADASHVDFVTGGAVRGRLSNAGEFFIGTTATALAGDLMNGVGNATFPWAINGYTTQNGAGVYGQRQNGAVGTWGSIQGETGTTIGANNSGVSGLASATNHRGVVGQKPAGGLGWGGLFLNDLGYSGGAYNVSDERLKINIEPFSGAIGKVMDMKFYTYYNDTINYTSLGSGVMHYGVMAQELKTVIPSLVATKNIAPAPTRAATDLKGPEFDVNVVNYVELIPIALQAIKEQQVQIEQQQATIDALTKRLEALEKKR